MTSPVLASTAADKLSPPESLPVVLEHFIGGAAAASADGATFEVADPVSNRPYATVAAGGPRTFTARWAAPGGVRLDGPWSGDRGGRGPGAEPDRR